MSPNWLLSVKLDPFGTDLKFYYYYFYYDYDDDDDYFCWIDLWRMFFTIWLKKKFE